jgi:hypothetical protein
MRFRRDAGLSEDFTCYVLATGQVGLRFVENIDSESQHAQCVQEVPAIQSRFDIGLDDVDISQVCADPKAIHDRADDLIAAMHAKRTCAAGDF